MNKIELRPYQLEIATAIMDSVKQNAGLTFSVEISRQGGKNELSAQLEVLLLTLFIESGGHLVKCSPTFKPQTVVSMQRLKDRLNDWGYSGFWQGEMGYIVRLGNARAVFFSADESANVVGATADILLEIDESQDVNKDKYNKDFKPMGATTNVTTVHYGTTWDDSTLLEEVKQSNLELERHDGIKRHFSYPWQEIAKYNPAYGRYVIAERARLGENHPLFLTQYCLQPLRGGGRFLSSVQLAMLQGHHFPQLHPEKNKIYIAGLDLAGEAEQETDLISQATFLKRDSTVLTIAELSPSAVGQPFANIVRHYEWIGVPHPTIYPQLLDLLKDTWRCQSIVVDATGIGEPVASYLHSAIGSRVQMFKFTQKSKSDLAFTLLAFINSGRIKMYQNNGAHSFTEFWLQAQEAKIIFRPNQTMGFYVDPQQGHDDYLMSLALLAESASISKIRTAKGRRNV